MGITSSDTAGVLAGVTEGVVRGDEGGIAAPEITSPPVIAGTPAVDQTLSITGLATSGTVTTTEYQWERDAGDISGATSSTYTLVEADEGADITVTVTVSNAAGSDSATSDPVGPVVPAWLAGYAGGIDVAGDRAYIDGTEYASIAAMLSASAMTYARSGSANKWDPVSGLLEAFSANALPYHANDVMLIEPARTNNSKESTDHTASRWAAQGSATKTADADISEDGKKFAEYNHGSNAQANEVRQEGTELLTTAGARTTYSIYLRDESDGAVAAKNPFSFRLNDRFNFGGNNWLYTLDLTTRLANCVIQDDRGDGPAINGWGVEILDDNTYRAWFDITLGTNALTSGLGRVWGPFSSSAGLSIVGAFQAENGAGVSSNIWTTGGSTASRSAATATIAEADGTRDVDVVFADDSIQTLTDQVFSSGYVVPTADLRRFDIKKILWGEAKGEDDPPAPARAVGYTTRTFHSTFDPSNVDTANTKATGKQWYLPDYFGWTPAAADDFAFDENGVTITGDTNGLSNQLGTICKTGTGTWHGKSFGGGFYFEAEIAFDNAEVAATPTLWPALWAMTDEHLVGSIVQWPGQAEDYEHFLEMDFFEKFEANTKPDYMGAVLHDWYGIWTPEDGYDSVDLEYTHSSLYAGPSFDWTAFNTIGWLWVPATASTRGFFRRFLNGQQIGQTIWYDQFDEESTPPATGHSRFGIADYQKFGLIVGTGQDQALTIRNVSMWQVDDSANSTGSS